VTVAELRKILETAPDDADVVFGETGYDVEYAYTAMHWIGIATPTPRQVPVLKLEGLST
jgi:hypothetical protein